MPEPTIRLTEEQIAFYHEQGYLAIDQITTAEEVAHYHSDVPRRAYILMFGVPISQANA